MPSLLLILVLLKVLSPSQSPPTPPDPARSRSQRLCSPTAGGVFMSLPWALGGTTQQNHVQKIAIKFQKKDHFQKISQKLSKKTPSKKRMGCAPLGQRKPNQPTQRPGGGGGHCFIALTQWRLPQKSDHFDGTRQQRIGDSCGGTASRVVALRTAWPLPHRGPQSGGTIPMINTTCAFAVLLS